MPDGRAVADALQIGETVSEKSTVGNASVALSEDAGEGEG